jgi:hypothetical protein
MPVIASAVNPQPPSAARAKNGAACVVQVQATLVSLNGAVVLGLCVVFTAFFAASVFTQQLASAQVVLFGILSVGAWAYLIDAVTERVSLVGQTLERTSRLSRRVAIPFGDVDELLLIHEGLNQEVGIESVVVRYRDGHTERLPLGPCWQRHELQAFLASVQSAMGADAGNPAA